MTCTAKLILLILAGAAAGIVAQEQFAAAPSDSLTPVIDHHQHLFSPAVQKISPTLQPINATELVKLLDEAGTAVALSCRLDISTVTRTSRSCRMSIRP